MRHGDARLRHHPRTDATDLRGALCTGDPRFTAEHLTRIDIANLLMFCHHCPVHAECAADREQWRGTNPEDWGNFTGVWGGQAYTRGRPR